MLQRRRAWAAGGWAISCCVAVACSGSRVRTAAPQSASPVPTPRTVAAVDAAVTDVETDASVVQTVVGTAHPTSFLRAAPDGRWVVLCQARQDTDGDGVIRASWSYSTGFIEGDALWPYLVFGEGAGERVDDFLGSDPSGRYLAVVRDGRARLIDSVSRAETELRDVDLREGPDPYDLHRAVDFDASGTQMLYFRGRNRGARIVVRDLRSGRETLVNPGAGLVWRAGFDPSGRWVVVQMLPDGVREVEVRPFELRPQPPQSRPTCRRTFAVYSYRTEMRVVSVAGGEARTHPGLVLPLGRGLLVRRNGALVLEQQDGTVDELVPAACGARLIHADVAREQVLVACAPDRNNEGRLELHGRTRHVDLGTRVRTPEHDELGWGNGRFPESPYGLPADPPVDLERGLVLPRDIRAWSLHEVASAEAGYVTIEIPPTDRGRLCEGQRLRAGDAAVVGVNVVDLRTRRIVGKVSHPWAVTADLRVLVDDNRTASGPVVQGPLFWREPNFQQDALCRPHAPRLMGPRGCHNRVVMCL